MTDNNTTGSNIVKLSEARKRKAEEAVNLSPLEAYEPQALKIDGSHDDWQIRTCDGEQEYIYIATRAKNRKTFKCVEIYPGLAKKRTRLRDVSEPIDLRLTGQHTEISGLLEEIQEEVLGDLEFDDEEN